MYSVHSDLSLSLMLNLLGPLTFLYFGHVFVMYQSQHSCQKFSGLHVLSLLEVLGRKVSLSPAIDQKSWVFFFFFHLNELFFKINFYWSIVDLPGFLLIDKPGTHMHP